MTTCRSCDAEVVFVPSAKSGKPMILDAKGVVLDEALEPWGVDGHGVQTYAKGEVRARVVDVYTDHHATCPKADDWKGKTRASAPA